MVTPLFIPSHEISFLPSCDTPMGLRWERVYVLRVTLYVTPQNMEYKFVELLSCKFTASPEDVVRQQVGWLAVNGWRLEDVGPLGTHPLRALSSWRGQSSPRFLMSPCKPLTYPLTSPLGQLPVQRGQGQAHPHAGQAGRCQLTGGCLGLIIGGMINGVGGKRRNDSAAGAPLPPAGSMRVHCIPSAFPLSPNI